MITIEKNLGNQRRMEFSVKTVDGIQPLTIFARRSILDVLQGYKYILDNTISKPGATSFIPQKNKNATSADFFHF